MRYIKPDYFDIFQCTADKCPDTCCAGWQIMIDDAALDKYMQDETVFGKRLRNGIDWREGSFRQYSGRCSMLNDKNLCDLVIEKGDDWLCETCSRYPRHVEEYEGLREWSLSLSCPVAAELMLNRTAPVEFLTEEDDEADPLEEEFEDFDFLLFTQLEDARKVMLEIVQNRRIPMNNRMDIILEFARKMQACLDEERLYDMDELIQSYMGYGVSDNTGKTGQTRGEMIATEAAIESLDDKARFKKICQGFTYLEQMERLREEWTDVLKETRETLYNDGYERYYEIYSAFQEEFGPGGSRNEAWEIYQEQLLIFFIFTYFCGAVYDDWIYSKVAFCVFNVTFIQEFVMCRWFLADKYIDMQDSVELAYRYAREVEHSDENLNFLEECLNGEIT